MTDTNAYHYTPQAVAKKIDVSVQSVRRWADTYKEFLSDSANPTTGKTRLYTENDVKTLRRIKELRDTGLTPEAIAASLPKPTKSQPEDTNVEPAALQKSAPDVTTATPALIVALDDLRNEFRAEIEALRQSRGEDGRYQRDFVVGLTLGAIGMCVVFILLVLLLYAPH
jgi:DNA-binding transcriptional MerR regulator